MSQVEIVVGIIGAVAAVLSASIPYYLTKRNELALAIQKTKRKRYDELLKKFVQWLGSEKDNEREQFAREFIMAYCRATSYASREVMTAIGEYIFYRQGGDLPPDHTGVSADELRAIAKKAEEKWLGEGWKSGTDKVFMAIREDILPGKPLPGFHTPIRPSQLDKYQR